MRHSVRAIRIHLLAIIALVLCAGGGVAGADNRAEARAHFQAGMKAYTSGDYRSALQEFGAAQQLSPADLNYYNLALCYDKLGEAAPAIQNYTEYLRKVPDAPKRVEIEASIARLDDALKSAAQKAEDAKRVEAIKRAEATSQPQQPGAKSAEAISPPANGNPPGTTSTPAASAAPSASTAPAASATPVAPAAPSGAGASGTPSSGLAVPTGDAQLDRVSSINIDAIRDQRGLSDRPSGASPGGTEPRGTTPSPSVPSGDAGPKAKPIYKEWWFWAIVAVGAVVVYEVATTPSSSANPAQSRDLPRAQTAAPQLANPLFRF